MTIEAGGSVLLSGKIDMRGGNDEGGHLLVEAGGDVHIENRIQADGVYGEGWGGEIDIDAGGDIRISRGVRITSSGGPPGPGGYAADGGSQLYSAAGRLIVERGVKMVADGAGQQAVAGDVCFFADHGIAIAGSISARARGPEGAGGLVEMTSYISGDVVLSRRAKVFSSGYDSGGIALESFENVIVDGTLRNDSSPEGFYSPISIKGEFGNVTLSGRIRQTAFDSPVGQGPNLFVSAQHFLLSSRSRIDTRGKGHSYSLFSTACSATFAPRSRLIADPSLALHSLELGPTATYEVGDSRIVPALSLASSPAPHACILP